MAIEHDILKEVFDHYARHEECLGIVKKDNGYQIIMEVTSNFEVKVCSSVVHVVCSAFTRKIPLHPPGAINLVEVTSAYDDMLTSQK